MRTKWEYYCAKWIPTDTELEEWLDGRGEDGWELISLTWDGDDACNCVFKRPLEE